MDCCQELLNFWISHTCMTKTTTWLIFAVQCIQCTDIQHTVPDNILQTLGWYCNQKDNLCDILSTWVHLYLHTARYHGYPRATIFFTYVAFIIRLLLDHVGAISPNVRLGQVLLLATQLWKLNTRQPSNSHSAATPGLFLKNS